MTPAAFNEENTVFSPPEGMNLEEVSVLSCYCGQLEDGRPIIVTCWKVSAEDLAQIQATGRIWASAVLDSLPCIRLQTANPFVIEG